MRDVRNLTLPLRILVTTGALLPLALALQPIAPATGGGMVDEQSSAADAGTDLGGAEDDIGE